MSFVPTQKMRNVHHFIYLNPDYSQLLNVPVVSSISAEKDAEMEETTSTDVVSKIFRPLRSEISTRK